MFLKRKFLLSVVLSAVFLSSAAAFSREPASTYCVDCGVQAQNQDLLSSTGAPNQSNIQFTMRTVNGLMTQTSDPLFSSDPHRWMPDAKYEHLTVFHQDKIEEHNFDIMPEGFWSTGIFNTSYLQTSPLGNMMSHAKAAGIY